MLALNGGRLIDGTGKPPLLNSTVLVNDDGHIEAVGPNGSIALPPDCLIVNISDKTVLPGLIDCHDHLTSFGYDLIGRLVTRGAAAERFVSG